MYEQIKGVKIWGGIDDWGWNAEKQEFEITGKFPTDIQQAIVCQKGAEEVALMADHHQGYSAPIGSAISYKGQISPSGVGYDISCGNKAVLTDADPGDVRNNIKKIMDDIWKALEFGIGRTNSKAPDHDLFDDDPAWAIKEVKQLKDKARAQLGTIGSGNHYVDIFIDEEDRVWIGNHFGSRGFGHGIATHYLKAGGAKNGIFAEPTLLEIGTDLGDQYVMAMKLAGRYAYAGRDWVCDRVARILGARIRDEVHNHHNFAWEETHKGEEVWVVRKGATPAFPGQRGFVGGSMGDISVIIEGVDNPEAEAALYSTIHGAGRMMGRRKAKDNISQTMMLDWVRDKGVTLRGAGVDESPYCYKRIEQVLKYHEDTIKILHVLQPIGVAMAGANEFDPYKD